MEFFIVRFQNGCKKNKKQAIFAIVLLVVEDSIEEEIKSKVSINFGSVKYFDNVHKMDNSTDCLLNRDFMTENTFTDRSTEYRSTQYKFQM